MEKEKKHSKVKLITGILLALILFIIILWFCLTIYEYNRVMKDKRPIICLNEVKDIESDKEYSITCDGILYKYREYYSNDTDALMARELIFSFKEFKRSE